MIDGSNEVVFASLRQAEYATGYGHQRIKAHCISGMPLDGKKFIFNNKV